MAFMTTIYEDLLEVEHIVPTEHEFRVSVTFTDGTQGEADLSPLANRPMFAMWHEPGGFSQVWIDDCGIPCWGEDSHLSPTWIYHQVTGKCPTAECVPAGERRAVAV